jgi:hypothetical protein
MPSPADPRPAAGKMITGAHNVLRTAVPLANEYRHLPGSRQGGPA